MASIGKYSFLAKLIWTLIRPIVVKAVEDKDDDQFSEEFINAIDMIISMDFESLIDEMNK